MSQKIPEKTRERAAELVGLGATQDEVARMLRVSRRSVNAHASPGARHLSRTAGNATCLGRETLTLAGLPCSGRCSELGGAQTRS